LEGIKTGQDISVAMQKLETEKMLAAAQLQEQEMRYAAEMQRVSADLQMSHAENIIKLLTHQPKELKLQHKEM
jgi:riboflavin synthase